LLDDLTCFDQEGEPALTPRQQRQRAYLANSVSELQRPDGPIRVLKTLQTSACERNCYYCPFRAGRSSTARVTFSPDELAGEFDRMRRAGMVQGLFLSSGIIGGGVKTMDKTLATVELLRRKYEYRGYIHLKLMPGAEEAQIEQAMRLADRVSINLEGANTDRLSVLAPQKDMRAELLAAMQSVREIAHRLPPLVRTPSLATQFVVGPAGESDRELLTGVDWLYRRVGLARAYYSAFHPVSDTPLAGCPATPVLREHRLYQADWLLRFYGFALADLPFDAGGSLPVDADPKLAWARAHLAEQPIEVNRAGRAELLRIPGVGPQGAEAILRARRQSPLRQLADLRALGVIANRAAPFILLHGQRPPYQLQLAL
jgi:predicted DNA-binding helix-hairpin-helix protein